MKLLLNQRTQCCDYIEEVINIKNINPNNYSGSSDYLIKSSISFQICDISLPQDQTGSIYFVMPQKKPFGDDTKTTNGKPNINS